jgi:TonB family protein
MSTTNEHSQGPQGPSALEPKTANERFKEGANSWFWASLSGAAVLHFMLFAFLPALQAGDWSPNVREMEALELPPEVEIPPPPEQIPRPATPVIAEADIDDDITMAPTTFDENPVDQLPPPPGSATDLSQAPVFTPMDVHPQLMNADEVRRALERAYPPLLRDAGIGGTVLVWFFIDENGRVQNSTINQSSGHQGLDNAALDIAELYRFSPALNRDQRVPVWVSIPIQFESRR